jgi:integrase
MPTKKVKFEENEIAVFEDAVIYKRGEYWQFRLWLPKERKYARFSLKTRNQNTAVEKAKLHYHELMSNQLSGKRYFSLTTKDGVAAYIAERQKDVDAGIIVKGRLGTIKTHLEHWLAYIKKDTKLKELERTDCSDYFLKRSKGKKSVEISISTIANEQGTINSLMKWLFKRKEAYIDGFDFSKLPKVDKNDNKIRRSTFSEAEVDLFKDAVKQYTDRKENKLTDKEWQQRTLASYYFLIASVTGLRTGEQKQLLWSDIEWTQGSKNKKTVDLVHIQIRAETSKVRNSRGFYCRDDGYFKYLRKFIVENTVETKKPISLKDRLVFSLNSTKVITQRTLLYHFGNLLALAEIGTTDRDIVPYSFRHYFITQKVMSGLNFRQIADMCGTSQTQIEKTYYHLNDEIKRTNAMADYDIDGDGLISLG